MTLEYDFNQIDFQNHDGVNLSMINDYMRNRFFENIIKDSVRDKNCIDIGFGTGFLSILALKHGAKHVIAYENNYNRFCLGKEIIQNLNLESKITLNFGTYTHDLYENDHVIITETVNGNLWQEKLFLNSIPRKPGIDFLPGEYFLNIYAIPVSESFAHGIGCEQNNKVRFAPGIDLPVDFVNVVNRNISKWSNISVDSPNIIPLSDGINYINDSVDTQWDWIPYLRMTFDLEPSASYILNATNSTITSTDSKGTIVNNIDFSATAHTLTYTSVESEYLLIVPRVGLKHKNEVLFLDHGHWGAAQSPIILKNNTHELNVSHNFLNGNITYRITA
jgi:hypothetical protein